MIRHAVAQRYAKALFQIDHKKHAYADRVKDFNYFFAVCKAHPKFLRIVEAPLIDKKEKESLLNTTLKKHVDPIFLNFLFYVIKKNRVTSLNAIFAEYEILVNSEDHVWEAKLVSSVVVPPVTRRELIDKLEKVSDKKIVLKEHVEPKIIGGTFLIIGNKLIDWSVKSRMEKLETHLLGLDICR